MIAVLQRVENATVIANGAFSGEIGFGLYILLGVEKTDTAEDVALLCEKIPRQKTAKEQASSNTCPFHFSVLTRFTRTEKLYAVTTDRKSVFRRHA